MAGTDGAFLERLLRALAAPATAALLAACGSSAVPPMGSTTTAGPTTTAQGVPPCGVVASAQVVVTPGPEPCMATTHVGATIRIVLDPGFHWDDPRSNSDAIQVGSIQRPPGGALEADLHAVAVGQATVTTVGTVACAPGQPCPALARLWKLHITVTQKLVFASDDHRDASGQRSPLHLAQWRLARREALRTVELHVDQASVLRPRGTSTSVGIIGEHGECQLPCRRDR